MIRITKLVQEEADNAQSAYHYVLAGRPVVFQEQVKALQSFEEGPASERYSQMLRGGHTTELLDQTNSFLQYRGPAQFDNAFRQVHFWRKNNLAQIDIDSMPICQIDFREDHIHLLNDKPFDEPINLEVVTGPALITLLASKRIYCMHAGAVSTPAGTIAFVGESGAGKSTLTAHVDQNWNQVTDDILPLGLFGEEELVAMLTDFPQLKLSSSTVTRRSVEPARPDFMVRINPVPTNEVKFRKLNLAESMLQIVRHTVAAKLYDQTIMREHARFAKRLTMQLPLLEISYPRDLEALPSLRQDIIKFLKAFNS